MITLKEYAERLGKLRNTCYAKYQRGGFKTAKKIGRDIFIDENEPYVDDRIVTGNYVGWHKGYDEWKRIQSERGAASDATKKK